MFIYVNYVMFVIKFPPLAHKFSILFFIQSFKKVFLKSSTLMANYYYPLAKYS